MVQIGTDSILSFGVINCKLSSMHDHVNKSMLLGMDFRHKYWQSIHCTSLEEILDLWQAGYSNIHIMKALALKDVPDKQFISRL